MDILRFFRVSRARFAVVDFFAFCTRKSELNSDTQKLLHTSGHAQYPVLLHNRSQRKKCVRYPTRACKHRLNVALHAAFLARFLLSIGWPQPHRATPALWANAPRASYRSHVLRAMCAVCASDAKNNHERVRVRLESLLALAGATHY